MQKLKFDAREGRTESNRDMYDNPWKYSFAHNFKVHFKRGILQALANKLDITISSARPEMPSTNDVMTEFNQRMKASIVVSNTRQRYSEASYHVTQIEYKESFAFYDPQMASQRPPPTPPARVPMSSPQPASGSVFCRSCGAQLPPDSKFCNRCGTQVV
jgi:ribosomal protein L40E